MLESIFKADPDVSPGSWRHVRLDGGDSAFGGEILVSRHRALLVALLDGLPVCEILTDCLLDATKSLSWFDSDMRRSPSVRVSTALFLRSEKVPSTLASLVRSLRAGNVSANMSPNQEAAGRPVQSLPRRGGAHAAEGHGAGLWGGATGPGRGCGAGPRDWGGCGVGPGWGLGAGRGHGALLHDALVQVGPLPAFSILEPWGQNSTSGEQEAAWPSQVRSPHSKQTNKIPKRERKVRKDTVPMFLFYLFALSGKYWVFKHTCCLDSSCEKMVQMFPSLMR